MIFSYIRVTTKKQSLDSQKNLISRYCLDRKLIVVKLFKVEISSRHTITKRKIDGGLSKLNSCNTITISELAKVNSSIKKKTLSIIEYINKKKQAKIIVIKQNHDLNLEQKNSGNDQILVTLFFILAELKRHFIFEKNKKGLHAKLSKGIKTGNSKTKLQKMLYDTNKKNIFNLCKLGVLLYKFVYIHLDYIRYNIYSEFIYKKYNHYIKKISSNNYLEGSKKNLRFTNVESII